MYSKTAAFNDAQVATVICWAGVRDALCPRIIGSISGRTWLSNVDIQLSLHGLHTTPTVWLATFLTGQTFDVPARGPCRITRSQLSPGPTTVGDNTSLIQFENVCSLEILTVAPVAPQKTQTAWFTRHQASVPRLRFVGKMLRCC